MLRETQAPLPTTACPQESSVTRRDPSNRVLTTRAPLIGVALSWRVLSSSSGTAVVVRQGPRNASLPAPCQAPQAADHQVQSRPNHGPRRSATTPAWIQSRERSGFCPSAHVIPESAVQKDWSSNLEAPGRGCRQWKWVPVGQRAKRPQRCAGQGGPVHTAEHVGVDLPQDPHEERVRLPGVERLVHSLDQVRVVQPLAQGVCWPLLEAADDARPFRGRRSGEGAAVAPDSVTLAEGARQRVPGADPAADPGR